MLIQKSFEKEKLVSACFKIISVKEEKSPFQIAFALKVQCDLLKSKST